LAILRNRSVQRHLSRLAGLDAVPTRTYVEDARWLGTKWRIALISYSR
jgi:hypothetical protein